MDEYVLPWDDFRLLHRVAKRAQRSGGREVCGLVTQVGDHRLGLIHLQNKYPGSRAFAVDCKQIESAIRSAEIRMCEVIGSFHSHPATEALPGPRDLTHAFFRGMELIYDVCGYDARLWMAGSDGCVVEVPLIVEGKSVDQWAVDRLFSNIYI